MDVNISKYPCILDQRRAEDFRISLSAKPNTRLFGVSLGQFRYSAMKFRYCVINS